MEFVKTDIPDVIQIIPKQFKDSRGSFFETYRKDLFSTAGISASFIQDNHSGSEQGVLRGLHYQIRQSQGKLIRVTFGEIYDVAVDLRSSSPTFGKWVALYLSAENKQQLWVPQGFAHGFYVTSAWAEVTYKVTDYYSPESERTLLWNDPKLGIDWPLLDNKLPALSPKDAQGNRLSEAELFE